MRFGGLWVSRITLHGKAGIRGLNTVDLVTPRSAEYAERALDSTLLDRAAVERELETLARELADEPVAERFRRILRLTEG